MKKTLISAVVAIALVLTMAVSAFAASSTAAYATTAPKIDGEIDFQSADNQDNSNRFKQKGEHE